MGHIQSGPIIATSTARRVPKDANCLLWWQFAAADQASVPNDATVNTYGALAAGTNLRGGAYGGLFSGGAARVGNAAGSSSTRPRTADGANVIAPGQEATIEGWCHVDNGIDYDQYVGLFTRKYTADASAYNNPYDSVSVGWFTPAGTQRALRVTYANGNNGTGSFVEKICQISATPPAGAGGHFGFKAGWNHFAVTWSQANTRLRGYLNGDLALVDTGFSRIDYNTAGLGQWYAGSLSDGNNMLKYSNIQDFRIHNVEKTWAQIEQIHRYGMSGAL